MTTGSPPRMSQRTAVSVVYVAVLFLNIMDVTIVNVALPTIGRSFRTPAASVDVVVIAYLVSLAVFIPASGWIGDRFGGKRTLLTAIVVFTGASALCGLAGSLSQLVAFRVLQGVGGGMLTPVGMAMLYRIFPPQDRVRLASLLMGPTALAPAIGPVLGGLLVTDLSWRWVFYVNLPIGLVAVVFGVVFVAEQREDQPGRFDVRGFALSGLGLGSLMYGVSEGPSRGWGSADVDVTLVVGAALLAATAYAELHYPEPMLDLRLLGDRLYRSCTVMILVTMTAFFGVLFLVPLYYQDGRGLSALDSGLGTFPEALGVMVAAQVVSRRLYTALGPRRLMTGGLIGVAVVTAVMSLSGAHTSLWQMAGLMFALGYCIPHAMVTIQAAVFTGIPSHSTGRASTLFNANRQLGGAIGVALLSSVLSVVGPFRHTAHGVAPDFAAYRASFRAASVVGLAGAALALVLIHDEDAAATMRRQVAGGRDAGGGVASE
ncbi:MAG: MDR family MFS transporter [Acidimicrobiales bacterium]